MITTHHRRPPDLGVVITARDADRWRTLVQTLPMVVRQGNLRESLSPSPSIWLIVLNPRTAPVQVAPWIATLGAPTVLVTPQIRAAQTIAPHVAPLVVVAKPADVTTPAQLQHVVTMAPAVRSGCLIYLPSQEERLRYA